MRRSTQNVEETDMTIYLEDLDRNHRPQRPGPDTEDRTFDAAMLDTKEREREVQRLGAHRRSQLRADKVPFFAWVILIAGVVLAVNHFLTF